MPTAKGSRICHITNSEELADVHGFKMSRGTYHIWVAGEVSICGEGLPPILQGTRPQLCIKPSHHHYQWIYAHFLTTVTPYAFVVPVPAYPSVPQNLQLKPVSLVKAVLRWTAPPKPDGRLIGYRVRYRFNSKKWGELNFGISTAFAFVKLKPKMVVTAALCARTEKDGKEHSGKYSNEVNLTMPTPEEWEKMSATTRSPPTTAAITTGSGSNATPAMTTSSASTLMPTTAMTSASTSTDLATENATALATTTSSALATATPTALVSALLVTSMTLVLA
ncbi:Oncosphere antigen A [Taenia solium]|eukprot:TsM_000497000 transcript=TsM_000497000 gene=TsM_000497000